MEGRDEVREVRDRRSDDELITTGLSCSFNLVFRERERVTTGLLSRCNRVGLYSQYTGDTWEGFEQLNDLILLIF